jgi:6-phosphogluconolactonase (cycloisomerase 2 family)
MSGSSRLRFSLAIPLLAALALLTGIGVGSEAAQQKTFVYVNDHSGAETQMFGFQMDGKGVLTPLPGSPFTSGDGNLVLCQGNCETAAYSVKRQLLFSTTKFGVVVWHVEKDGTLTLVPDSTSVAAGQYLGVGAVEKGNKTFVYANEHETGKVYGWVVNSDASLTELDSSPTAVDPAADGMAVTKDLVYVACEKLGAGTSNIHAFRVQNDGSLLAVLGSPFEPDDSDGTIFALQINPSGTDLYAGHAGLDEINQFRIKRPSGSLNPSTGHLFTTPNIFADAGLAVSDSIVVAAHVGNGTGDLQVKKRLGNGSIRSLGPLQNSGLPGMESTAITKDGKILVVAAGQDGQAVRSFRINKSKGSLAQADNETATTSYASQTLIIKR